MLDFAPYFLSRCCLTCLKYIMLLVYCQVLFLSFLECPNTVYLTFKIFYLLDLIQVYQITFVMSRCFFKLFIFCRCPLDNSYYIKYLTFYKYFCGIFINLLLLYSFSVVVVWVVVDICYICHII